MKPIACIIFILLTFNYSCQSQILEGYLISISRISSQTKEGILDLETGTTIYLDSLNQINGGHVFKTSTSFIAGLSKMNSGKIITAEHSQKRKCSFPEHIEIPSKVPFKTLTVDFKNREKPAYLYIYKAQFTYCTLDKKDLRHLRSALYSDSLNFIAIREFVEFEKVDKYFLRILKSQITSFGFGYDNFYDDGFSD